MLVFMVAEKPSLAQSIAKILSNNQAVSHKGFNGACSVHEWSGKFMNYNCKFRMTSVCGHVMSLDFNSQYNNWDKVDPAELFVATTLKKEASPNLKMPAFLEKEARGSDYAVLWLDCDKEGENICFEVIDAIKHSMNSPMNGKSQYLRARFSSITDTDIKRAMNNLVLPNKNEALSVDARQELDLRIGCAFTRFQTRFFQGKYGDLDSSLVSYGPCQTPTLSFCVDRMDKIKSFKPENYWYLDVSLRVPTTEQLIHVKWSRVHLFEKEIVYMFFNDLKNCEKAKVTNVKLQEKVKQRICALNTVEMLRSASAGLGMSPMHTMQIAERLYTQGYISYPRTETTQYAPNFNFNEAIALQVKNSIWGDYAKSLLGGNYVNPRKGTDVGDHPPITPTAEATQSELNGDSWRLYEFITRHFLATLSPDCRYEELTITFEILKERFTYSGKNLITKGWTDIVPWKQIDSKEQIPSLREGDSLQIETIKISEGHTSPPDYLTESELIGLMEKHGIGTDASIPVHVNNVSERNYVKLERDRRLVPTTLGIVLVHGYKRIDPELCLPRMRSSVEAQLTLIALGKANYHDVLHHTIKIFEQKFHYFVQNISLMDTLFEDSFSSLSSMGKPMSRCGKCRRFMKLVQCKPQRLYCENCKDTYNLPQNGSIKLYRELKCPLDDFELLINAVNKNYNQPFCPYCYNNPPFPEMPKGSNCFNCSHPTCPHSYIANGISQCFECANGVLQLDSTTPPKYRILCNKCNVNIAMPDTVFKMEASEKACDQCETPLLDVIYHKDKSPLENGATEISACLFCDKVLKQTVETFLNTSNDSRNRFNKRHHHGKRGGFKRGGHSKGGRDKMNW